MNRKIARIVLSVSLLIGIILTNTIFSVSVPAASEIEGNKIATNVIGSAKKAWHIAAVVVQVLSVAAVVMTGLRYMFASADTKADIKKQTMILVIGASLVFAATTITSMIYTAATTVIQQ